MYNVGYVDCVHTKGLGMNTLPIVLYSLSQGFRPHPDESLARESVYSWPVTGRKSEVRSVVVSCWSVKYV